MFVIHIHLHFKCWLDCNLYFFLSVYEGEKSFYKEEDITVPVNVYGKTKVAAEQFISEKCSNYAILRSSIIYGPQTVSPVPKSLPIQVHVQYVNFVFYSLLATNASSIWTDESQENMMLVIFTTSLHDE